MEDIYAKIKQLRLKNGWTLRDLSTKTDLSVSFLSQVERGTNTLAITSLKKIADALNVHMTYFFEEPNNDNYVVRKEDQKPFRIERSESTHIRLSSNFIGRSLEPELVILKPRQKDTEYFRHPGEEFYYVIKGAIIFKIEDKEYFLREGDAIYFPSTNSHKWENPLNEEVTLLSVITPIIF